jgi:sugar lactone lactonase YvrE
MSRVSIIANYNDECGECPVWDPNSASLYWTDLLKNRFYRYHSSSGNHELISEGVPINGFRLNEIGGFVIANNHGIWLWKEGTRPKLITSEVDGSRCQMNDCIADPKGRFVAGSYFYDPATKYELGKLIRIDTDGKATIIDEGFHLANGLGFSPDCATLYFTDSVARVIYAYDYDTVLGNASNRRVFVRVSITEGIPDGLAVDNSGFVWSAQWYGGCIVRYDPDGKRERVITIPAKQTSSIAFGGRDLTDVYVTSASKFEPLPIMPINYDPCTGNVGGELFHLNLGIEGKPEFKANISGVELGR